MIDRGKKLAAFERCIGYKFKNKELLLKALTHSSFANSSSREDIDDNERLEFLGDAILQATLSDLLFKHFPKNNEGELSKTRASMVNRYTLAMLGEEIAIGSYLLVGKSIIKDTDFYTSSLIADAFEALIGAIYLDGGYRSAKSFVHATFSALWEDATNQNLNLDYKSILQEISVKRFGITPRYDVIGEFDDKQKKCFEVELRLNGSCSRGIGKNKKNAEQDAAKKALLSIVPKELQ